MTGWLFLSLQKVRQTRATQATAPVLRPARGQWKDLLLMTVRIWWHQACVGTQGPGLGKSKLRSSFPFFYSQKTVIRTNRGLLLPRLCITGGCCCPFWARQTSCSLTALVMFAAQVASISEKEELSHHLENEWRQNISKWGVSWLINPAFHR